MVIIIMKKQASNVKITRTRFGEGDNLVNFIHISDLHIPMHQVSFKKICGIIHDERPHFVVITGDLCLKGHLGKLETFLYMLSNSARCPIYITLGNHDNILFNDEPLAKSAYINALENISYIRVLRMIIAYTKLMKSLLSQGYAIIGTTKAMKFREKRGQGRVHW